MATWFLYFLGLFYCCLAIRENSFKFKIPAGWYECFYEDFDSSTDTRMEVTYEVIKGGDLDIRASISSPEDEPVLAPEIKTHNFIWEANIGSDGPYSICLDNSFSLVSEKVVFLQIIVHERTDEELIVPPKTEGGFNGTTLKVLQSSSFIRQKLTNVSATQTYFKTREARHLATVESNYDRVFMWSLLETIVMVAVFIVQVVIIRRLVGGNKRRKDGLST